MICNAMDWDINVTTPMNYVEALLLYVNERSEKDRLRRLSYEMVVLCLTGKKVFDTKVVIVKGWCLDVRCMDLSPASIGMGCLLIACEMLECGDTVEKHVDECDGDTALKVCFSRLTILWMMIVSILGIVNLHSSCYDEDLSSIIHNWRSNKKWSWTVPTMYTDIYLKFIYLY